jgi:hypothetical protein
MADPMGEVGEIAGSAMSAPHLKGLPAPLKRCSIIAAIRQSEAPAVLVAAAAPVHA